MELLVWPSFILRRSLSYALYLLEEASLLKVAKTIIDIFFLKNCASTHPFHYSDEGKVYTLLFEPFKTGTVSRNTAFETVARIQRAT